MWWSISGFCCCRADFLKVVPIFDLDKGSSCEQDNVGGGGVLVSQVTKDSAGGGGGGDTDENIGK